MKKIIAVVFCFVLLAALAATPCFAQNVTKFYIEGPSSVKTGDTFEISLIVEGSFEAHALNLRVFFDNTSFRYVSKTTGAAYEAARENGGICLCDINMGGNAVSVGIMMPIDPMTEDGELVKLKFEVLPTASSSVDFGIQIEEFTSIPVGTSQAVNLPCVTEGMVVNVQGGSGGGTTPIPVNTPKPAGTNPPHNTTPTPSGTQATPIGPVNTQPQGGGKETPPAVTEDPGVTADPNVSEEPVPDVTEPGADNSPEPVVTAEPSETEAPGRSDNKPNLTTILLGIAAAALVAVAVLCVIRAHRRNKEQ